MGQSGPDGGMQARAISVGSQAGAPRRLGQVVATPTGTEERSEYIRLHADQLQLRQRPEADAEGISDGAAGISDNAGSISESLDSDTVSYTHLTLPTILLV
eukprot:2246750-Pyramimonas_sp.AAC.1